MTTTVCIYARYSTDEQDPRSIEDQVRRCTEHAERHKMDVVAEFADRAVSGSHTERAQLRRMIDVATATRRPPFRAVLVDDLSRLSRNMGDFWRVVDDLAGAGIAVIDVQTGMSSEDPNARMVFGAKSLVNDQFLAMVKYQTHRGLTGRALAGFSAGGSLYGYRTVAEPNPTDAEHPRKLWVIHNDEAAIVRRVFAMYDDGAAGYKAIADQLNREGIPAPRDGKRGHKSGTGWGHTSVKSILSCEKYIGRWAWNTTKWTRTGKKTIRRARPKSEHVVREMPELAIVSLEVWERVQKRAVRINHGKGGGRPPSSGKHAYLLSGLLKCGTCGGPMSICGSKVKNGVRYTSYACSTNRSRGSSKCPNDSSIGELKIREAFLGALKEALTAPETVDRFVRGFERRIAQGKATKAPDIQGQLRDAEQRVANLTRAIARMPDSEALYTQLASEEATVRRLRGEITTAKTTDTPKVPPSKAAIRGAISKTLDAMITESPERAREILARAMEPLVLRKDETPGTWSVSGAVRLRRLAAVSSNLSSGGRI